MRGSRNFLKVGGGPNPRRGLTENFNMAKNDNLAIPRGGSAREIATLDEMRVSRDTIPRTHALALYR